MTGKEAIQFAIDHARSLFGVDGQEFRLEEVEPLDDGGWDITVSFIDPQQATLPQLNATRIPGALSTILGVDLQRQFKIVRISGDGKPASVRIRTFTVTTP